MTFLIIDASNMIHRYFHALPELSTQSGIKTHAVAGWIGLLVNVTERLNLPKDTAVVVFWDKAGKADSEGESAPEWYKSQRESKDPSLYEQITVAMALTKMLGFAYVGKAGVEADSLIGSFVLSRPEDRHYILSSDKDMLQLVNDQVSVVVMNGADVKVMDAAGVEKKWGVKPSQMADLLILMGDKSDNIPGVPGIGQKTAQELLNKWGSLTEVYKNVSQLKPAQRNRLLEAEEKIPLYRQLIEFKLAEVKVKQEAPDFKAAKKLMRQLEMVKAVQRVEHMQAEMLTGKRKMATV